MRVSETLLLALLLAGTSGSDIELRTFEKGDLAEITVVTLQNEVLKCFLVTPLNNEIDLLANETLPDKYEYRTNFMSNCRVRINDLDKNDEGVWSLHAVLPSEDDKVNEQIQQVELIKRIDSSEQKQDQFESSEETSVSEVLSSESSKLSAEEIVDSEEASEEDENAISTENSAATSQETEKSEGDNANSEETSEDENAISTENSAATSRETEEKDTEDIATSDENSEDENAISAENSAATSQETVSSAEDIATSDETSEDENVISTENSAATSQESVSSAEDIATSDETSEDENVISTENSAATSQETVSSAEDIATSDETSEDENVISTENSAATSQETVSSAEDITTSDETSEDETPISTENSAATSEETAPSAEDIANSEETSENENATSTENSARTSRETESLEASDSEEENVKIQWLSDLQFITRTGLNVDINLPLTLSTEKCTITKPDGTTMDIGDEVSGMMSHSSSNYVSCRVVVGPMDASLIGLWTLCGSYEENYVEHRRCQRADIVWRNPTNPDSMWQTTINSKFEHVVNFGGTLTPAVQGSGTVTSCHVVTPDNEDLIVTQDREYPNIRLVQDTVSTCSIAIGPIVDLHLGDWTIYGTFNSALFGHNEVRLPFSMELYNEYHPYDQAYNVTTLNPTQHVVNLGSTIPVEVTSTGAVDLCQFTMPSGMTYFSTGAMPAGVSFVTDDRVACRLSIGPITEKMIGEWLLIGKFSNRDIYTENRLTFTIIQEDPSNPIEEDRTVQYLDEQLLDTDIGTSHRVVISSDIFNTFQSCHVRTPEGLQYTIMEGFDIPGVKVVTGSNIACGVTIQVSEDLIGNWTLIAWEIRSSQAIERRQPFNIYVEESVEAIPNEVTITEGNSIHIRLANPTDLHATCRLYDPKGQQSPLANLDGNNVDTCGFVVTSVDAEHSGTWNIVYGTKVIYKAAVLVNVIAREDRDVIHLTWVENTSVNQTIGPEEAVFCRVRSPRGDVLFDDFGRCRVIVDRLQMHLHDGIWTMVVGLPGRIVTENHLFVVKLTTAVRKPEVASTVSMNKPTVQLTCSVTSAQEKTGCLFRNPVGEVLVASPGVSDGRYVFHVSQTTTEFDSYYYSCGLQITEPVTSDLGLWRCDLETEEDNYYGFVSLLRPWAMEDPTVAESVVTEPVLTAQALTVSVDERDPATLACSARAPLRYCYFRAPNGTIYNLSPGMSSTSMEYVGAGLDAGECGVRILSLLVSDSGAWSCHAGLNHQEQSQRISVFVQEEFVLWSSREREHLVIEGQVGGAPQLEYCRFVRIDGFGFASDNAPFPYIDESILSQGLCRMRTMFYEVDLHPWTVVAKVQGRDGEISRVTRNNWPELTFRYYSLYMWLPLMLILLFCVVVAGAAAPVKNRRWAAQRASSLRISMRASLRRFPGLRKQPNDTNPAA